jgi:hypothetical protein
VVFDDEEEEDVTVFFKVILFLQIKKQALKYK